MASHSPDLIQTDPISQDRMKRRKAGEEGKIQPRSCPIKSSLADLSQYFPTKTTKHEHFQLANHPTSISSGVERRAGF